MSGLFSKPKTAPIPTPAEAPPPIPPVIQTGKEVVQAERDQKRIAAKRKGIRTTVLGGAGEAGGTSYSDSVGQRSLLGGGGGG